MAVVTNAPKRAAMAPVTKAPGPVLSRSSNPPTFEIVEAHPWLQLPTHIQTHQTLQDF